MDFFDQVYAIVRLVPVGRVTSYGAIAKAISMPKAARMVGYAMSQSHSDPTIPAHRVVNSQGLLTGRHHFQPPELMEELLQKEGVKIINNRVIDYKKLFWDPILEL